MIVATSNGWGNYRHQSDAAAMYQLLKQNGVSDENIILFMIDDISQAMENNPKNSLFHIADGKNNYRDIEIDYKGVDVTEKNLTQALLSLESDENTNVLLYIANHGGDVSEKTAQALGGDLTTGSGVITFAYANSESEALFTSDELGKIVDKMSQDNLFRQMLIIVEACFSGAMGTNIDQPGVLFMSASNASEVSYGANYDPNLKQWLADNFTYQFIAQAKQNPRQSIENFYFDVYQNVPGSHVTLLNYKNFGDIATTPISEFISP